MAETNNAPRYWDIDETARYLRVSASTLNAWRCYKKGPAFVKIGGRVFYTQSDLDVFIDQSRRSQTAKITAKAA